MPGLARLYVRTSLVYLAAGGLLGALLLWNKGAPVAPALWSLLDAHIMLVLWGWLLQLSLGVAYWVLPRVGGERPRAWLAAAAYGCLNAGVLLQAAQSWLAWPWLAALAGVLEISAGLAFTAHAWPRVHPAQPRHPHVARTEPRA